MDFIYDFVEKRGGIENVTREIELERKSDPAASGKNLSKVVFKSDYHLHGIFDLEGHY